jgi:histidinol-phosphate aminotransferase
MLNVEQLARPCILARKDYVPGKPVEEVRRELGLEDVIKLASNENPLGTSPLAVEAMVREITANANRYPESLCPDLANALARTHGLTPEQVFLENGLDGVITRIGMAFLNPGEEVIFGRLTFPAYANMTARMDARAVSVPLTRDFRLDVAEILAAITPRTKLIFLCNPNNPTGMIVTRTEYARLLAGLPETAILVMDEAYADFVDDPQYPQSLADLAAHPNLIVLRTFSKLMGLAGLRVGYALAGAEIVRLLRKTREPFPVNRIAQAGALAALDDQDFRRRTLQVNRDGREFYLRELARLGVRAVPSQANFVFMDLGRPARPVFEAMLREGVIVRPVDEPGWETCLRISIGLQGDNERALAALARALGQPAPSTHTRKALLEDPQ